MRKHNPAEAALKPDRASVINEPFSIFCGTEGQKTGQSFVRGSTKLHFSDLKCITHPLILIMASQSSCVPCMYDEFTPILFCFFFH